MRPAALLLALCALASAARADDVRVEASLQPDRQVPADQAVRLIVRVVGSFGDDIDPPRIEGLKNLRVVSGPSTSRSSRFEFVNGRANTSTEATFVYTLLPGSTGPAEVPALEVRVAGAVRRTEPLRLEVVAAGAPGPSAPSREGPRQPGTAAEDDVYLRTEVSSREVWVGEPLTMEVRLYSSRQVAGANWTDTPDLKGFWNEDLGADPRAEGFRTSAGGRELLVYPLVRKVLVPTAAGEIEIGRYASEIQIPRRSRDLFSEFFGRGVTENLLRQSPAVTVRAKPLPAEGRPDDFGGDVGTFRIEAGLDRREAAVNDAVSLKVTVRGEGWLPGSRPPAFEPGDRFKVFDATATGSSDVRGGRLRSERTFEWVLVPLVPGDAVLPEIRFSFFDPEAAAYRTVTARPGDLSVRRSDDAPDSPTARSLVVPERRDLRFVKSRDGSLDRGESRWHRSGWFPFLLALPWLLAPAWIVFTRRRARLLGDRGRLRASRALKRARRTLAAARRTGAGGGDGFHETVARALVEYVADRHDRSASGLTYDLAEQLLAADGRSPELRARFRSCLERCDLARYVPGSEESATREEVLREAASILEALEGRR